jgi:hypothetical protein
MKLFDCSMRDGFDYELVEENVRGRIGNQDGTSRLHSFSGLEIH